MDALGSVSRFKILVAVDEGDDWIVLPIHSIVIEGMRYDAANQAWSQYRPTIEEIEGNQTRAKLHQLRHRARAHIGAGQIDDAEEAAIIGELATLTPAEIDAL